MNKTSGTIKEYSIQNPEIFKFRVESLKQWKNTPSINAKQTITYQANISQNKRGNKR